MNQASVSIESSYGRIVVRLDPQMLPNTVNNFLRYVDDGFYDSTLFHRVVDSFIIQGGGFEPGLIQKTVRQPILNESTGILHNRRGAIAMARRPEEPDSATSQFFINTRHNDVLDYQDADNPGYCVFGEVVDGMGVVERIEGVSTTSVGRHHNVPLTEIVIHRIERTAQS